MAKVYEELLLEEATTDAQGIYSKTVLEFLRFSKKVEKKKVDERTAIKMILSFLEKAGFDRFGQGSSRVTYISPLGELIKVAKEPDSIKQNKIEISLFNSDSTGIFPKVEESGLGGIWFVTEKIDSLPSTDEYGDIDAESFATIFPRFKKIFKTDIVSFYGDEIETDFQYIFDYFDRVISHAKEHGEKNADQKFNKCSEILMYSQNPDSNFYKLYMAYKKYNIEDLHIGNVLFSKSKPHNPKIVDAGFVSPEVLKENDIEDHLLLEYINYDNKKFMERWTSEGKPFENKIGPEGENWVGWLEQFDPTQKKKYVNWFITRYLKGTIKRLEDIPTAKVPLEKFEILSRKNKLRPDHKDINKLKTVAELMGVVSEYDFATGEDKSGTDSKLVNYIQNKEIEIFYDSPNYSVLIPKTQEASCFVGRKTAWCTANEDPEHNMFDNYSSRGNLYVIFNKKNNERTQLHIESKQFMDEKDEPVDPSVWFGKNPEMKDVFKFQETKKIIKTKEKTGYEYLSNLLGKEFENKFVLHSFDDQPVIWPDGTQKWFKNGSLHRGGDEPAVIWPDGTQRWYKNGKPHREGDEPAVIKADGTREWWKNDLLHREGDEPALVGADGTQLWFKNSLRHREGDKPAVIRTDGTREWYKNGRQHRDGDEPAVIYKDGGKEWYKKGERYFPAKKLQEIQKHKEKTGQKFNSLSQIESRVGDPWVLFHKTEIEKLGINPRSTYSTPLGLYFYNLDKETWEEFTDGELPFKHEYPISIFVEVKPEYRDKIITVTSAKKQPDGPSLDLEGVYQKYQALDPEKKILRKAIANAEEKFLGSWVAKLPSDKKKQYGVVSDFAIIFRYLQLLSKNPKEWRGKFIELGVYGIIDRGVGLLHPDEPNQSVMFFKGVTAPILSHEKIKKITKKVDRHGTIMWLVGDKLHREGGKPAVIHPDGSKEWWFLGHTHRGEDKPAVTHPDGTQEWYKNGLRHREKDKPAVIKSDGTQEWWKQGDLHREGDRPAIIKPDGTQKWFKGGWEYTPGEENDDDDYLDGDDDDYLDDDDDDYLNENAHLSKRVLERLLMENIRSLEQENYITELSAEERRRRAEEINARIDAKRVAGKKLSDRDYGREHKKNYNKYADRQWVNSLVTYHVTSAVKALQLAKKLQENPRIRRDEIAASAVKQVRDLQGVFQGKRESEKSLPGKAVIIIKGYVSYANNDENNVFSDDYTHYANNPDPKIKTNIKTSGISRNPHGVFDMPLSYDTGAIYGEEDYVKPHASRNEVFVDNWKVIAVGTFPATDPEVNKQIVDSYHSMGIMTFNTKEFDESIAGEIEAKIKTQHTLKKLREDSVIEHIIDATLTEIFKF